MALTPKQVEQIRQAAIKAHEGRPLFPSLRNPQARAKPAWLVKGWLELTGAERAEFRAMKWDDFKTDEERVQAMVLQQQRLTPPKL